jgi:uncharacterized DUF497 family protein
VAPRSWDPEKARTKLLNHKVSFSLAERIFGDPGIATRLDPYPHEERWQSVGKPSADSNVVRGAYRTRDSAGRRGRRQDHLGQAGYPA